MSDQNKTQPITPEPKLKEAVEEVQRILKKHDLCGFFVIGAEKQIGTQLHLDSSWSLARSWLDEKGNHIQFEARANDPERTTATGNFLFTTENALRHYADLLGQLRQSAENQEPSKKTLANSPDGTYIN